MNEAIRVVQYGCGPIGCRMVSEAATRSRVAVVGAVDVDPAKIGTDIGTLAQIDALGVAVVGSVAEALTGTGAVAAIHTTGSYLERVASQLIELAEHGLNVVSTCEELSFPYRRSPQLVRNIDEAARANKVTILATGINPGFLMDTWPSSLTALCTEVREVHATRIQDARSRRGPFQAKIGAGLTPAEFRAKVQSGTFGHVGLTESLWMIADTLGLPVERIEETIEPVMLEKPVSSDLVRVSPGQASGIKQVATGFAGADALITLDFQAYLGAASSYDEVCIVGTPDLSVRIDGGAHGDVGTIAMAMNALPRVVDAQPGLLTMRDLPLVFCSHR